MQRHKFHTIGVENGQAIIDLVDAMMIVKEDLAKHKYFFTQKATIYSQMVRRNQSWSDLPLVLYQHAFNIASRLRSRPKLWESTGSRNRRSPSIDGRWQRIGDGTIMTLDLGPAEHWTMRFDRTGGILDDISRLSACEIHRQGRSFAVDTFNKCDVLVMEDFRRVLANDDIISHPDWAWIDRIDCVALYRHLVEETKVTRRRLVLVDPAGTSWTCKQCGVEYPWFMRYTEYLRHWTCQACGSLNERNRAACLAFLNRFLKKDRITYDTCTHGPAGIRLKGIEERRAQHTCLLGNDKFDPFARNPSIL